MAFQETWLHRARFPASFSVVGNGLQGVSRAQAKNSYRGAVGFWGSWPFRRPGYTERASRLLFCGEGWLAKREQGTGKKSYRGAIGLWGWWPFRRPGYTERASRLLFCGEGWLARREQGTGKKSYRGAIGFWGWWPFRRPGYTERASRLLFCGEGWLARCEQGTGKKFLPRRARIPLQAACSGAWLDRTCAPASFQW